MISRFIKFNGTGKNERIASTICGLLLLFILLTTSVQALCFWIPGWWRSEYAKYDTPANVSAGMSLDDAVYVTEQMLEYCMGNLDSLDGVEATVGGEKVPFFTEREKLHLADCRELFLAGVRARTISIFVLICLLIAIWFSVRRRVGPELPASASVPDEESAEKYAAARRTVRSEFMSTLAKGWLTALAIAAVLAVIIALIGLYDFTFLFTEFHHLFFDNDLWILYPDKDNLINIMQEDVFADAAVTITGIWVCTCALITAASIIILRRTPKHNPQ